MHKKSYHRVIWLSVVSGAAAETNEDDEANYCDNNAHTHTHAVDFFYHKTKEQLFCWLTYPYACNNNNNKKQMSKQRFALLEVDCDKRRSVQCVARVIDGGGRVVMRRRRRWRRRPTMFVRLIKLDIIVNKTRSDTVKIEFNEVVHFPNWSRKFYFYELVR